MTKAFDLAMKVIARATNEGVRTLMPCWRRAGLRAEFERLETDAASQRTRCH
jgi:hypothetical protein